jgi:hypothetical protein
MEEREYKRLFSEGLERTADAIDLTEAQYKSAISKYEAVTAFLSSDTSLLKRFNPQLLSQGSFRLGTVVRPIIEEDEFDVDVTLKLNVDLPEIQESLKTLVARQFESDKTYQNMLKEKRRCWRVQYSEASKFHMDIVPALPLNYRYLLDQNVPQKYAEQAIVITDNEHKYYKVKSIEWPKSNTEGFALWFLDVMKEQADRIRMDLQKSLMLEHVQDVPFYKVRTPLQRAIQLMKRHRDSTFDGDDNKPASIIITVLAAKAYKQLIETTAMPFEFYDVLSKLLELMPTFIENRNGVIWIENPIDSSENFGDRWKGPDKVKRETMFRQWVKDAKSFFEQAYRKNDLQSALSYLKPKLNARSINEAIRSITGGTAIVLSGNSTTPMRFDVPHRQKPVWKMNDKYDVSITCKYKDKSSNWNWVDLNGEAIPKHYDLMFKAIPDSRITGTFEVFWQVVNTGAEAEHTERGLRGEIFPAKSLGLGGLDHKESTLYKGVHWIECFLVQNSVCIARSGEYIVKIKE